MAVPGRRLTLLDISDIHHFEPVRAPARQQGAIGAESQIIEDEIQPNSPQSLLPRTNLRLVRAIADAPQRPAWKKGDFFAPK